MDKKREKRLAKFTLKRLTELEVGDIKDPRRRQGRKWSLLSVLRTVVVSLMAGRRSLADVEDFTRTMSSAMRRRLGIRGRVPDTTMRDVLCCLQPGQLRRLLHRAVKRALQRKALTPTRNLPFGVVAMDGKATALSTMAGRYVQKQTREGRDYGLLRTFTSCLISAAARPCIDVLSVPSKTNEMGAFPDALRSLLKAYPKRGRPFGMITYDAGACSVDNAALVVREGLHYLFALKESQPTLAAEARRLLGDAPHPCGIEQDMRGGQLVERRLFITSEMSAFLDWSHLATVLRVQSVRVHDDGTETMLDDRYFLSSYPVGKLTSAQWLHIVRAHWGVENNCHHTFDTAFAEDAKPWITGDAQGALNVLILRRLAYTLMTLFRTVTQRSEEHRQTPWKQLLDGVYSLALRIETLLPTPPVPPSRLTAFP